MTIPENNHRKIRVKIRPEQVVFLQYFKYLYYFNRH